MSSHVHTTSFLKHTVLTTSMLQRSDTKVMYTKHEKGLQSSLHVWRAMVICLCLPPHAWQCLPQKLYLCLNLLLNPAPHFALSRAWWLSYTLNLVGYYVGATIAIVDILQQLSLWYVNWPLHIRNIMMLAGVWYMELETLLYVNWPLHINNAMLVCDLWNWLCAIGVQPAY